jgi:hypothetical protein
LYIDEYFAIDPKVRATALPIVSTFGHMMIATSTQDAKLNRNEVQQMRIARNPNTNQPIINLQEVHYRCNVCKKNDQITCNHNPVRPMWIDRGEKIENIMALIKIVSGSDTFAAAEMDNADVKTQEPTFKSLNLPCAEDASWWIDFGTIAVKRIFAITDPSDRGDSKFVTTFIADVSYTVSSPQSPLTDYSVSVVSNSAFASLKLKFFYYFVEVFLLFHVEVLFFIFLKVFFDLTFECVKMGSPHHAWHWQQCGEQRCHCVFVLDVVLYKKTARDVFAIGEGKPQPVVVQFKMFKGDPFKIIQDA